LFKIHTPVNRLKMYLGNHPSFIGNSHLVKRSKTYLGIHPFFIGNSYPRKQIKNTP
jgi:hypothetical protein